MSIGQRWRRRLVVALLLLLLWDAGHWLPVAPLDLNIAQSRAVFASDHSLLRLTLADDQQYRLWVPLEAIAPVMREAMLLKEDHWFYAHPGVNPYSLMRAAYAYCCQDNRQGGSTVTMQLARLLYHLDTRSLSGKFHQIRAAIWLEWRYSKKELLTAYLNLAPFGGNIVGVETASQLYFGKAASALNLSEALSLAVIPQQPHHRPAQSHSFNEARQRLLSDWKLGHRASASVDLQWAGPTSVAKKPVPAISRQKSAARQNQNTAEKTEIPFEELPLRIHAPFLAPHFTDQLLRETQQASVNSTLDPVLQRLLERQARQYVRRESKRGIQNAVALLVDTRDMGVKALLGSVDYQNNVIDGQVNGVLAKRSPGSTLKPFIYALALDQGIIHPLSILKDAPASFGPYTPENFDGRFAGPLPARDALIRSRNIPAVWLATQLQQPDLYGLLQHAGVGPLQAREHYGLALVLGGGEVSMEELAGLYAMLANQGMHKPLRYRHDETQVSGTQLLSHEAAWLTLDMLNRNPRPDGLATPAREKWFTAWKTGTSWGFRDAWTAGIVGPYVLLVWIGNFNNEANPAFVGIDAAAPLWWRIADALPLTSRHLPSGNRPAPNALRRVGICSASGQLPNAWCPQIIEGWFIPGKSPIKVSELHRPVMIDTRTGNAACPPYDPAYVREEVFEFWPSDLAHLFRQAGLPRRAPPSGNGCNNSLNIANSDGPEIRSPMSGLVYTLHAQQSYEQISLSATVAADVKQLYWFANASFIGSTTTDKALGWRPDRAGQYRLTVTDDRGRSSERSIAIDYL